MMLLYKTQTTLGPRYPVLPTFNYLVNDAYFLQTECQEKGLACVCVCVCVCVQRFRRVSQVKGTAVEGILLVFFSP
jgi:hypothetical protein